MTKTLETISAETLRRTAVDKEKRKNLGYPLLKFAKSQAGAHATAPAVPQMNTNIIHEGADRFLVSTPPAATEGQTGENLGTLVPAHERCDGISQSSEEAVARANPISSQGRDSEAAFRLVKISQNALVVFWNLDAVDETNTEALGAICKEFLTRKDLKTIVFDFSQVTSLSTPAISTLIRFRNSLAHFPKTVHLVAGKSVREQLAAARLDSLIDIHESIYFLVGTEIDFIERATVIARARRGLNLAKLLGR